MSEASGRNLFSKSDARASFIPTLHAIAIDVEGTVIISLPHCTRSHSTHVVAKIYLIALAVYPIQLDLHIRSRHIDSFPITSIECNM